MCEETNPVNVIKFVSFVTPSKMKFKNIYKMSKSDRRDGERAEIQTESERAGQNENNPPLNSDSSVSTPGIISSKQS